MKIVIAGAGEVGYHLIENLSHEEMDISVIDTDKEVLDKLKANRDVEVENANIIDSAILNQSDLSNVDLFLAITSSDETNMIACRMAKEAGAKKTICRIRQISFEQSEEGSFTIAELGIDQVINPVELVAAELYQLVLAPNMVDSHEFLKGKVMLAGFNITRLAVVVGQRVGDLEQRLHAENMQIGVIQRKNMSFVPDKDTEIQLGDVVYFFFRPAHRDRLRAILGYYKGVQKTKRIFINGGGHIGLRLARYLERAGHRVGVIEKDAARAHRISEKLNHAMVFNFDGTDLKQLRTEGLTDADFFFSVTNAEEVNLAACLLAARDGVGRTICLVMQPEYIPIIDTQTPISLAISPRVITARYLTRFIQSSKVDAYFSLGNSQVEVLELNLDDNTPCLGKPLNELELSKDVKIGLIHREGKLLIPKGETRLLHGDCILLTCHRMDRRKLMQFFHPQAY